MQAPAPLFPCNRLRSVLPCEQASDFSNKHASFKTYMHSAEEYNHPSLTASGQCLESLPQAKLGVLSLLVADSRHAHAKASWQASTTGGRSGCALQGGV